MTAAGSAAGIVLLSLVAQRAAAEWSGTGKLGGVIARGNSETATANANLELVNQVDRWKHKFGGSILRTLNEEETSADRWELRAESEYTPTDRVFTWVSGRYENDRFSTYAYGF